MLDYPVEGIFEVVDFGLLEGVKFVETATDESQIRVNYADSFGSK